MTERENTEKRAAKSLAPELKTFVAVQLLLTLACAIAETYCDVVLHLNEPYNYPFPSRYATFWDFVLFAGRFSHFHNLHFFDYYKTPFTYPAPLAVLYAVFFRTPDPLIFFLAFMLGSFTIAAILLGRALTRRGVSWHQASLFVVTCLIFCYPLWFDFKQGNIEIGVWVFVAIGAWSVCSGKNYQAAACFAIAGSMKIFPFVFLGLLISQRKYREVVFSVSVAIAITVVSLWMVGGPHIYSTWKNIEAGIDIFREDYMLRYRGYDIGFDHSAFGLVKCFLHSRGTSQVPAPLLREYLGLVATLGIALYYLRIRHLPLINQVLALTIASILLPPVSYDYTLIHLYVPWAMLVLFSQSLGAEGRLTSKLGITFIILAILMAPESEFIHNINHIGGQIKAVALIVLLGLSLTYSFPSSADNNREPGIA